VFSTVHATSATMLAVAATKTPETKRKLNDMKQTPLFEEEVEASRPDDGRVLAPSVLRCKASAARVGAFSAGGAARGASRASR